METFTLPQNILLGLSLAAPIGPVNLEIIKRGLKSGFRQAFLIGAGAMSADATYLILIFFGLVSFLSIPLAKTALGVGGGIVLLYLGMASVKDFFETSMVTAKPPRRLFKSAYAAGYMLALFSPMTIVWWTGVFGALLAAQSNTLPKISAFLSCLSILLGCFLWVTFLSVAAHWGKKIINEKFVKWISLIAGIFLIGFGIYFLYRVFGPIGRP